MVGIKGYGMLGIIYQTSCGRCASAKEKVKVWFILRFS